MGQGRVQSEANLHSSSSVVGEDFSNDGITSQAPTLIKSTAQKPQDKVCVDGARRVWGTMRVTTPCTQ